MAFSSFFSISCTFSSPPAPLVTKALSANIRRNAYRNQSLICQRMKLTESHPHNRSPQLYKAVKTRMPKWLVLHCLNRPIRLSNKSIRNKNLWKTLTNFIDIDDLRTSKSTLGYTTPTALLLYNNLSNDWVSSGRGQCIGYGSPADWVPWPLQSQDTQDLTGE